MDQRAAARFASKIELDPATGCWVWIASRNRDDYGQFWLDGTMRKAHVVSYLHFGGVIPAKYEVDHLCRNHRCVAPLHLEAVTHRVNTLRGIGPTAVNATLEVCKNGHPFTEENTRINPKGSRVCTLCEKAYMTAYYERNREKLIAAAARNKAKRLTQSQEPAA